MVMELEWGRGDVSLGDGGARDMVAGDINFRSGTIMRSDQGMQRSLAGLFSIDAWHMEFDDDGRCSFHISMNFSTAKLGGDGTAPVSFTVRLKRAEVIAVMPRMGEFKVDPSTVARLLPGEAKVERTFTGEQQAKGAATLALSPIRAAASLEGGINAAVTRSTTRTSSEMERPIIARDFKTRNDHYGWEITPRSSVLAGPVWDATKEPRFILLDKRAEAKRQKDAETNNQPLVTVLVKCRREDLKVDDIRVPDDEKQSWLSKRPGQAKRLAAAESFIRECLMKEGLTPPDISGDYVEITLADCVAEQV